MKQIAISIVTAGALIISLCASAEEPETTGFSCPERPDRIAKARKLAGTFFSEAEEAFAQERYEPALEKFVCSLRMTPHENTIINIERTLEKTADKSKAATVLKTVRPNIPDGELRVRLDEIIAAIETTLAEEAAAAQAAACPKVQEASPPCPSAVELPIEIEFRSRAHKLLFVSGWTSVGIGAATFITAVALQAAAASAKNKAQSTASYDVFLDKRDKHRSLQAAAAATFVTGFLTAGVGAAQLVLLSKQQKELTRKKQSNAASKAAKQPNPPSVSFMPGIGRLDMEVTF